MPVRKVYNRGRNIIGKFPSIKMGRMIAFESLIECDFIYLLDYEKEVEWFEEQPLRIEYQFEEKILHYTPDFHLIERGRDILVECKPEKFVNTEENQYKASVANYWCAQHGWEYQVVTGEQIRNGFRLKNIKLLTRYARYAIDPTMRGAIYILISHSPGKTTINEIAKAISPGELSLGVSSILYMAFHHEIYLPLDDMTISDQTPVYPVLKGQKEKKG